MSVQIPVVASDGSTSTVTLPDPTVLSGSESPEGTSVTTIGPTLNASPTPGQPGSGNLLAITPGRQISLNGVVPPGYSATSQVVELYYTGHTAFQKNALGNWYGPITATDSGGPCPDPTGSQPPSPPPAPGDNLLPLQYIDTTEEPVMPGAIIVQPQGNTDVSANVTAAMTQIKNSVASQHLWAPSATQYLLLPPGVFTIKQINALLGAEGTNRSSLSLVIRGAGYNQTSVVFSPSSAGSLMKNDYWQGIRIEGVSFIATTSGCTFLASGGNNAAQDYAFTECLWQGWKYIADLVGSNNNSEYRFTNCYSNAHQNDGAWLHIGSGGSDQFLNYWFYGCKMWSTSAAIIDAAKGGSFKIYGFDVSNWGIGGVANPVLFRFTGSGHAQGVCNAHISGLRLEAKNANACVLQSQWNYGAISFTDLDVSSQLFAYNYGGNMIDVQPGPTVAIRDSILAGHISAPGRGNSAPVLVDNTQWWQQASPAAASPNGGTKFVNCMNGAGGAVWNT